MSARATCLVRHSIGSNTPATPASFNDLKWWAVRVIEPCNTVPAGSH